MEGRHVDGGRGRAGALVLRCLGFALLLRWVPTPYSYGCLWWLDGTDDRFLVSAAYFAALLIGGLLALRLSARTSPRLAGPPFVAACAVLNCAGLAVMEGLGHGMGIAVGVYGGSLLAGVSWAGLLLAWAVDLCGIASRYVRSCVYFAAAAVSLMLHGFTADTSGVLPMAFTWASVCLSAAALVLARRSLGEAREEVGARACGAAPSGAEPASALQGGLTALTFFLFALAAGIMPAIASRMGMQGGLDTRGLVYSLEALCVTVLVYPCLAIIRSERVDMQFVLCGTLLAVGLVLLEFADGWAATFGSVLDVLAFVLFLVFAMLSLSDDAVERGAAPTHTFARGLAPVALGLCAGMLFGGTIAGMGYKWVVTAALLPACVNLLREVVRQGPPRGHLTGGGDADDLGDEGDPSPRPRDAGHPEACPTGYVSSGAPTPPVTIDAPGDSGGPVVGRYGLSPREEEVLRLLARGWTHQAIADELFVSTGTVKTHVKHIYEKTGAHSRQQLITMMEGGGGE